MAIDPTLQTHDILLSDGTTTLGLVVEKDENGIPIFRRLPADSLSQQQFSTFSEAIFPPQYQGFITQKEWHKGFGKQEGGQDGGKRYRQSFGTDASVKGLVYPSPVVVETTFTIPTYASTATISNGDFETGDFTNWSAQTNWSVVNTGTPHGGTWHAKFTGVIDTQTLTQTISATDESLFVGLAITVTSWTKYVAGNPSAATMELQTDAGLVLKTINLSRTTSYVQNTLSHTFADGYVGLKVVISVTTDQVADDFFVDDVVLTLTGTIGTAANMGTIVKLIDFNSLHYAVSDTGVWKRTAADWARVAGSPDAIVDCETFSSVLMLARGNAKNYWYMAAGETFTRNTGTGNSAKVEKFEEASNVLYGKRDSQTVYKYSSYAASTTSASYTVGLTGDNITALVEHLGVLYILKESFGAYIDSTGAVIEIVSELRSMYNTNTGKNSISWRGNGAQTVYIPTGAGASLMTYDDGLVDNIGPDVFAERLGDFKGQIVATASDDQWLYAILDNGTKIEILKGRYETIDGAVDFRWHPIKEITYTTVSYAHVSSITAKRLYFGGGTALPQYIPLPTAFGDPLNDTTLTFDTAVTFESCWYDLNLPRITKTYLNCTLDALGLSATKTIKIEYQLWESQGTWTELGGVGNGSFITSPTQTKTFATSIAGRKIRFRYTFTTDDTAVGYGMLQFTCRLALGPSRLDIFVARVRVKNKNLLKNGNLDNEMIYSYVAPQLLAWADTQPLTLTYPDGKMDATDGSHDGATLEVKFAEGYPREQFLSLGEDAPVVKAPESIFDLMLVSIDRSVS